MVNVEVNRSMNEFGYCLWMWLIAALLGCEASPSGPATGAAAASPPASQNKQLLPPEPTRSAVTPNILQKDDWFEDLTDSTGIRFTYNNGREAGRFFLLEGFGGGVAMIDFDRDDDVDLFLTGGGTFSRESPVRIGGLPSAMFRNEGGWRFVDVTNQSGFAAPPEFSQGCAVSDYNADGFPDVLVCCYGRSRLYSNLGDGTFSDPTEATQLPADRWGTTAAFGDIDRDGLPDLLLARYTEWSPEIDKTCFGKNGVRDLCGPTSYPGTTNQFFHNSGDGSFEDWSERVGLQGDNHGLGVVATDLNVDGWVDFYVANDIRRNHLYLGGPDARLFETGSLAGVAFGEWGEARAGMGIDVGDYNGDGLPDIFVTNFENEDNSLFRNMGAGLWMYASVVTGLSGVSRMNSAFGTSLTDFDGDGWLDIFVFNGSPIYTTGESPFEQRSQLFRNLEGKRFEDVSHRGGTFFREEYSGRGNAVGDLDNDGASDIVVVPMNEPVRILRNRRPPQNYVRVQLTARDGEPDATGARVTVDYAGRSLVRFVVRGGGYFSQFDARIIFPVDPSKDAAEVTVAWPGRGTEVFRGLAVRQTHYLLEGAGEAVYE